MIVASTGKSYTWSYDNNGNITSKKTYSFTTGTNLGTATETVTYSYGNSNVKDLLTSYNGTSITYSGLNPTKWRNASNITWEGRRMTSLTSSSGTTTHFIYDASGRRTTKYSASNETEYVWNDEKLIREITSNYTISYYYDGSEVIGFNVLGSNYYYGKDAFGVIRYIYGENGTVCTTYTYDAWGRVLSIAGSNTQIGQINPIRYKSYYYDTETGFYFLQSRYYDPTVGRFLNADDPAYLGVSGTVLGWNLFAYCENDAIGNRDAQGMARVKDSTLKLVKLLLANLYESIVLRGIPFLGKLCFYNKVKDSGKWDYKNKKPTWAKDGYFYVVGHKVTCEQLGNFNYGFCGAAMYFSPKILFSGGGFVNICNKNASWSDSLFFYDMPDDHIWIGLGIELYRAIDTKYRSLYRSTGVISKLGNNYIIYLTVLNLVSRFL